MAPTAPIVRPLILLLPILLGACEALLPQGRPDVVTDRASMESFCAGPAAQVVAVGTDREGRIVFRCDR
ncbi:MAG: hypothetical protein FJX65_08850 [Alphaproteobacteria bacterium]|nr:hypothetical protein [Alphaproteobacteria bacterium]